jgi:hypothetical protein
MGILFSNNLQEVGTVSEKQQLEIAKILNSFMNYSFALENFDKKALHIIDIKDIPKWVNYFEKESKLILLNVPEDERTIIESPIGRELVRMCIFCVMLLNKQKQKVYDLLKYSETRTHNTQSNENIKTLAIPAEMISSLQGQSFILRDNLMAQENVQDNKFGFFNPFLNTYLQYTTNLIRGGNISLTKEILPHSLITYYFTNLVRIKKQQNGNLLLDLLFTGNKTILDLFPYLATILNYIETYNRDEFNSCITELKKLIFMNPNEVEEDFPNIFTNLQKEEEMKKYDDIMNQEYTSASFFTILQTKKLELIDNFSRSEQNIKRRIFKELQEISINDINNYSEWTTLDDIINNKSKNRFQKSLNNIQENFLQNYRTCENVDKPRLITNERTQLRENLCYANNFSADSVQSFMESHNNTSRVFAYFIRESAIHAKEILRLIFKIVIKFRGLGNTN